MKNKKELDKEIKSKMLESLNDFMKDFGIEEIQFGKTHKIKKTDNKQKKKMKKILVVEDEKSVLDCFGLGAKDFISKPFNPNELVIRIKRFI